MTNFKNYFIFFKNKNLNDFGQICFYLGTFFLASALPISGIFFLIAISLSLIDGNNKFLKCNWNKFLIILSGVLIAISTKFYLLNQEVNLNELQKTSSLLSLFNWIPSFFIFILFQKYLENEKKREVFSKFLVAGLVPVVISCILQYWFKVYGPREFFGGLIVWFNKPLGDTRVVTGLFSNQNYTGFWLSICLPFLVPLIKKTKKIDFKFLILNIILILSLYFLFLTNSRNAIIGFIISNFIVFGAKRFLLISICFFILITILNSIALIIPRFEMNIGEYFFNRTLFSKISLNGLIDFTEFPRIKIWLNTINFIIQKPIFGFGSSLFPLIYLTMQDNHNFPSQHAHNMPLQLAFEYGIPTSLLLTGFVVCLFYKSWIAVFDKNHKISILNKCWIASSLIAITSHLTDITYYDGKINILIWILLSGLKCIMENPSKKLKLN